MQKSNNQLSFTLTYQFISGAYFVSFVLISFMLLNHWHKNTHPIVLFFSFIFFILLIFCYVYIHKKIHNIIISTLTLVWIVTLINIIYFLFHPINEALFLFAFIPIILFVAIREKKILLINSLIFYMVLFGVIIYNLQIFPNNVNNNFFIIFIFFNFLMIFFGIYYQKTMNNLITNLEKSNEINSFLLKETHHRIKNNLNLLSSILALQLDFNNPKEKEFFFTNQQRIESIAKLHEILYKKENLSNTNLYDYILEIIMLIQKESAKKIIYDIHIEKEILPLNILINIGIIITEIFLNSIKYNPNPQIKFFITFNKEINYKLTICENSFFCNNFQKSFGFELINMAVLNLYGKIKYQQNKNQTCFIISFPLKVDNV